MFGIRTTWLALAAGASLALSLNSGVLAPRAEAQQFRFAGRPGMGMGDRITKADVDRFVKILGLSDTQSDALKDLFQAYDAEYEQASKEMQEKFEKLSQDVQDTGDWSLFQKEGGPIRDKFQAKSDELEKSLMGDLKALLTSDQATKWPTAERAQRRAKSLAGGFGGLAGESVDLVEMVQELKLEKAPDAVTQTLDRYEIEIDQAIIERDAKRKEIGDQMMNMGRGRSGNAGGNGGFPDFSKMGEMMQEIRKSGIKVRDINDRYSTQLAAALPQSERESFTTRYRTAKFPQIYKEPYALKALNAAKEFKDLTSEQKTTIDEMIAKYQRELDPANERYARAQADAEKDGGGGDMMGFARMFGGGDQGDDDSELTQARKARRKLDSEALDKLKALLTEDQKDRLPERENQMWGMPRGR